MRGYRLKKMGWFYGTSTISPRREDIYGYYETHIKRSIYQVNTLKRIVYKCSYVNPVSPKGDSLV